MQLYEGFRVCVLGLLILITTLLVGFSAAADELLMKDGSRLLGKVIKEDDGINIDFETAYAGVIKVKWAEVAELITEEPMVLLLKNGETLKATKGTNTEKGIVIVSESGATETFDRGQITYVNPEPWRLGEGWKWSGNANVVLNNERGNSKKDEYEADIDMTFRRIDDRFKFYGDYDREKSNDELTDDDWRLNGRYDHFINKKFYYGGVVGLEHDRFADLRLRTMFGPMLGYEFYESKMMNLDVAAGPMWVEEDFYDEDNDEYAAFGWSFDFDRYLIPDRVQFYHKHRGLLEADDKENLVWDAWTGLRFPIYAGIAVSTEVLLEYDGGAADGIDNMDTTYNVKLGYQW